MTDSGLLDRFQLPLVSLQLEVFCGEDTSCAILHVLYYSKKLGQFFSSAFRNTPFGDNADVIKAAYKSFSEFLFSKEAHGAITARFEVCAFWVRIDVRAVRKRVRGEQPRVQPLLRDCCVDHHHDGAGVQHCIIRQQAVPLSVHHAHTLYSVTIVELNYLVDNLVRSDDLLKVTTRVVHQLLRFPLLDYLSVAEDSDLVCLDDRRQPVGDDYGGPVGAEVPERRQYFVLRHRI
ncbi:ETS-related transcription factor Elf-3, putative [Babesia ovata]|uniref:ETS-related transcription factor Elf-3, putative n=1 Tax=Babesia ovata TaxID=189622 RepID=A0A2H6K813_9APIC|nr:ETS-related transcription factor Elf-3, putative [Babesia ovata]GBE59137.1 ETS-related transcription factor Elf-3, putative [Babesia ovata]